MVDNKLGRAILFSEIFLSDITKIFAPFLIAFSAEYFNSSSACFIPLGPPSKGAVASKFHESLGLEILWTAVPTVILIAMAVPATSVLIEMYDTKNSDVDIKITGHQWKWQYDYLGEDVGFFSNMTTTEDEIYNRTEKGENYLEEVDYNVVVPTGQKVRFLKLYLYC